MIRSIVPMTAWVVALIGGAVAHAIEEPAFEVIDRGEVFEVRRYAPYIVAETTVDASFGRAGNRAFRILAGYIFGKNDESTKMQMTAPVETRPAEASTSLMTAGEDDAPGYTIGFVMESKYTLDTLPAPEDPRVKLREVPGRKVAALRFSGRWTEGNYEKHERRLLEALDQAGYEAVSSPMLARYNGPMTPWFMRRNEVLIEVEKRP